MKDYRYTIHKEGRQLLQRQVFDGVGVVIICENRAAKIAEVSAMTVYGNYCYHWDSTADIALLLRSTDDYLMDKFLDGHGEKKVLDVEATVQAILAENAEDGVYEVFRTDDATNCRNSLERCATSDDLIAWADDWGYALEDLQENRVYGYSEAAREFIGHVLPLIRQSAEELARMRSGILM